MDSTGWLAAAQKLDAFEEHGATLEDLNTAIAELSAAVELGIPAPERLGAFSALSHALRRRFCRCEASADAPCLRPGRASGGRLPGRRSTWRRALLCAN